ncbi:hypothetical protein SLS53_005223 [Cytospora paraplurivora]|uniref:Uncharacterized protein n=1 Tax=Cytospora paraplurivora TaxID=2898453 RepID=A0AAN9YGN3_9PEZI
MSFEHQAKEEQEEEGEVDEMSTILERAVKTQAAGEETFSRATIHKHKRPPRITLPDSAISGRTIDGHRHIAISIPVEHDLLSPAPRYRFPSLNRRTKSTPSAEMSPCHNDVTGKPESAFIDEPQIGTQLRPVAEKRGSRPSKSRGKEVQRSQEAVRELRLPWRDTFGPPQEVSRSNAGSMQPPAVPRRTNHGYDAPSSARPSTPPTSDEARRIAHRKALAALSRPVSGQSAYSFHSFATASPASKVSPPAVRNFSLHPGSVENELHRARSNSGQRGRNPHSRDSSRDQYTLQESIFSEPRFLESKGTLESASEVDRTAVTGTTQARRSSSTVEASSGVRNGSARESGQDGQSGQSLGRVDPAPNVQETRRDSGQETENSSGQESKTPHWGNRDTATPVSVNPAMKTVEAHITRQSQLRKSVQIVLETPEEDSWPDDLGKSRGDAGNDGLRGMGNDRNKGPESKGGNNKEASSMLQVPGETQENRRKGSPLPSPEQREEMRKRTLLLRRQKIAKLRKALEDPETQPKDLVWRRSPSDSSDGSSDESHTTDHGSNPDKRTTMTHAPDSLEGTQDGPDATTAQSQFSTVMTVADVRPSSPLVANAELGITSKESLPLSTSSLDTVATAIKVPPMPPYQHIGHVTPPDSPPHSQTSPSPVSSVEAQPGGTPLRHPPLKRLPSLPRRSSTFGRRPPVLPAGMSPVSQGTPQPNIASKDALPSTFHSGQGPEGESTEANTSVVKMSRSQLFEMHDTLREERTRDIERRLQRLERNRDDWMATMLPLLTDMTQVLGKFASSEGDGEGREGSPKGDRQVGRPRTSESDDRQTPNWRRSSASGAAEPNTHPSMRGDQDDVLDSDEVIRRHTQRPHGRSRAGTSTSEHTRRLYIDNDLADDEQERRARSSSLGESSKRRRHRAHTTNVPPPALPAEAANLRAGRPLSGTTRSSQVPALPRPPHIGGESEAGRERVGGPERGGKRVDARLRSLSLGARVPGGLTRYDSRRDAVPDFYAATANDGRYNETLEGLMRGSPSRISRRSGTKSVDAAAGHGVRQAPGAVVGFGAFST